MTKFLALLFFLFLFSPHFVFSQKQANNWLFGQNAWISFETGVPVPHTGGMFSNLEGSASISDSNGKLLFYTNGQLVWNSQHAVMPNGTGLLGSASSTQSAVIVPNPGNANQYYVFTIDDCLDSLVNGFRYSIVDLSLQNGLGEVTTKNQLLHSMTTEKITAVVHSDNTSIWVITHGYKNNEFYAYLVTPTGIQFQPVVSTCGTIHNGTLLATDVCHSLGSARGYMKTSPDGKRIALAVTRSDFVEIFDFDNVTGRISNPSKKITLTEPYGLEFSPDGSQLYVGGWKDLTHKASVFQVDLASMQITTLATSPNGEFGAVQLGPDQKLYVAVGVDNNSQESPFIASINYPNKKGTACNFVLDAVNLSLGTYSLYGLPTFIQTYFYKPSVSAKSFCLGDQTSFLLKDSVGIVTANWDFDDPASGAANKSKLLKPNHQFSKSGSYLVKSIFSYLTGRIDTVQTIVRIYQPKFALPHDSIFCANTTLHLDPGSDFANYKWSDGSSQQILVTNKPGRYRLNAIDLHGCPLKDSIKLIEAPILNFDLGNDTSFCDSLSLKAPSLQKNYVWNGAKGSNTYIAKKSGQCLVVLTDNWGCIYRDSIQLTKIASPQFKLGNDTLICSGQSITINAPENYDQYTWQDNSHSTVFKASETGIYRLTAGNKCGNYTSSLKLDVQQLPGKILQSDTAICDGSSLTLNCTSVFSAFQWSDGSTMPSLTLTKGGRYTIKAQNSCGWFTDSVLVKILERPHIPFPADTAVCEGSAFMLDGGEAMDRYQWNTGSTDRFLHVYTSGHYFVKVTNWSGCSSGAACNVIFNPTPVIERLDTSNYAQAFITASGGTVPYNYQLNLNSPQANPLFKDLSPGNYTVKVIDSNHCISEPELFTIGVLPIDIPNFFTPNNDGINDYWEVGGLQHFPDAMVWIFDRNGRLLCQFKSGEAGWNGAYGNMPLVSDDYWYKIDLKYMDIILNGHFTLKR